MTDQLDKPIQPLGEELDTLKEYQFSDTEWKLANLFDDPDAALTIKNIGSSPVSVFFSTDKTLTIDNLDQYLIDNAIDPTEIGGLTYEISSDTSEQMFIKSLSGDGKVSIRIYGTVDPTADVTELAKIITQLSIQLDNHERNYLNSHRVDKIQVGLGNIPNAVTDEPEDPGYSQDTDDQVVVSLRALRVVLALLIAHIETITANPHQVNKNDVALGLVANYPPATQKQAIDAADNTVYLTPWSGALLVKDLVQIVASVKPQTVLAGQVEARLPGWSLYDTSVPTHLVEVTGDRVFRIKSELQVAYAYHGKTLISKVLGTDIICNYPPSNPNGISYVYVSLDGQGNILGWGNSVKVPETGTYVEAHSGDFFNTSTCEMIDGDGNSCIRVYVGKIYFTSNKIVQAISVPFGDTATIPIVAPVGLGKSALIANPFIDKVETVALVEYGGKWGKTEWNDQIGVVATPRPNDEYNNILVQVGAVGYLACGSNAGSAFGESFQTIVDTPRMAIKIKKS